MIIVSLGYWFPGYNKLWLLWTHFACPVGLFIIPQGQNNISEPKSKSYKKVIIFMIKGPK
jgi:hypothetical protein